MNNFVGIISLDAVTFREFEPIVGLGGDCYTQPSCDHCGRRFSHSLKTPIYGLSSAFTQLSDT